MSKVQVLSREEAETHADLGIAYLEMGLVQDALDEFRLLLEVPGWEVRAIWMLGRCYVRMGDRRQAIGHLERALRAMDDQDRRRQEVEQDLAQAYGLPPPGRGPWN